MPGEAVRLAENPGIWRNEHETAIILAICRSEDALHNSNNIPPFSCDEAINRLLGGPAHAASPGLYGQQGRTRRCHSIQCEFRVFEANRFMRYTEVRSGPPDTTNPTGRLRPANSI